MVSDWMGRYRQLVAAMVLHTNIIAKSSGQSHYMYDGVYLTSNELQVLEYIAEHRQDDEKMILISEALGITQSTFSKIVKHMSSLGLIERYRSIDNKKNVILKPTEFALNVYESHSRERYETVFKPFFDALEGLDDAAIEQVANAISLLNENISRSQNDPNEFPPPEDSRPTLIKIDD